MNKNILVLIFLLVSGSLMAQTPTLNNLVVMGTGIQWYAADTGGSSLLISTLLVDGTTYYASQTVNGVESTTRLAVTATVIALPFPIFTTQPGASAYIVTDVTYSTESGKENYVWTYTGDLGIDYSITSGGGNTNSVTLKWLTAGNKTVTISSATNGCRAASATSSTETTVSVELLALRDEYQGGEIFYILQSDDAGYNVKVTHGLIVSPINLSDGTAWSNIIDPIITSIDNSTVLNRDGLANSNLIIGKAGHVSSAAKLCFDYTNTDAGTGVYPDWYFLGFGELRRLCLNLMLLDFNDFWTSGYSSSTAAWYYDGFGDWLQHLRAIQQLEFELFASFKTLKPRLFTV